MNIEIIEKLKITRELLYHAEPVSAFFKTYHSKKKIWKLPRKMNTTTPLQMKYPAGGGVG